MHVASFSAIILAHEEMEKDAPRVQLACDNTTSKDVPVPDVWRGQCRAVATLQ